MQALPKSRLLRFVEQAYHRVRLAVTYYLSKCLVAGPISGLCSRSASDFVKLTGELDAVLRYEVETTAGEEV